jgi:hypothetical protein
MEAMDPDFCSFVIDRSTEIAEDSKAPKSVINTHLCVLTQQNFSTKIMTAARAERIVDAVHDIADRVKGNGVYAYRLLVYRKLIGQVPNVMIAKIRQWFEHVFHAMLSSQKDTRQHGIDVARLAGTEFGTNSQASKAVLDFLNIPIVAGGCMASYLVDRLMKMLEKKGEASPSPQIWGAVTLFLRPALRNSDRERWRPLRSWLTIFEKFLNSNSQVKYHANIAFNSLVFVVNPPWQIFYGTYLKASWSLGVGVLLKRARSPLPAIILFFTTLSVLLHPKKSFDVTGMNLYIRSGLA